LLATELGLKVGLQNVFQSPFSGDLLC